YAPHHVHSYPTRRSSDLLGFKGLNTHPMHIGGAHEFDFGKVKYTQAFHGSSFTEEDNTIVYTGMPGGILLTIDGKTIYHVGDTRSEEHTSELQSRFDLVC